jgi:hypothetical protein
MPLDDLSWHMANTIKLRMVQRRERAALEVQQE